MWEKKWHNISSYVMLATVLFLVQVSSRKFEIRHIQELESKLDLRKSGLPPTSNFECQICHRMCRSLIGLLAHNKSHSWWWDWDGSVHGCCVCIVEVILFYALTCVELCIGWWGVISEDIPDRCFMGWCISRRFAMYQLRCFLQQTNVCMLISLF